jgi:hypothetical protein
MGALDVLQGLGDSALQGVKDMMGMNQKAILEIADFSNTKIQLKKAQRPEAPMGNLGLGSMNEFDLKAVSQYTSYLGIGSEGKGGFEAYKGFKKYRFECQFNPEQIQVTGYGGEELPIQSYRAQGEHRGGSHMASANTRIDLSFRLVFDKTNIQDAFYYDKFILSPTSIVKGAATGAKQAYNAIKNGKANSYSVQPEVEALTAIVRDNNKRLARFYWGDIVYEGIINTVSAEYVMFNVNCEPIRAFVNIGMVLYDEQVAGAHADTWAKEYLKDIYSLKDGSILDGLDEKQLDSGFGVEDDFSDFFSMMNGG